MSRIAGSATCRPYCACPLCCLRDHLVRAIFRRTFPDGDYRNAEYDGTSTAPPLKEDSINVVQDWFSDVNPYRPDIAIACEICAPVFPARDGVVYGVRSAYSDHCFVDDDERAEDSSVPNSCIDQGLRPNTRLMHHCDGTIASYGDFDGSDLIEVKPDQRVIAREAVLEPCGRTSSRKQGW